MLYPPDRVGRKEEESCFKCVPSGRRENLGMHGRGLREGAKAGRWEEVYM